MKRLPTIRVRRSKRNPDFWEVTQNGRPVSKHLSKKKAEETASARSRVLKKRRARVQKAKRK
jgi:hypothetical protein